MSPPTRTVRWGVLSPAKIGTQKVVPAMQRAPSCEVVAIASRDLARAEAAAADLGLARAHGSYQALLDDPEVDAVYNPLPNHLHLEWNLRALEAGKHVLCEKPIGVSSAEAERLAEAARQRPELKVMEAFMYRLHPQWQRAKTLVEGGEIGDLRTVQSFFSFFNRDPDNIRNQQELGGGAMLDIGCYCVSTARFLFGREPERVMGEIEFDPDFGVDRLASGILDFGAGTATFTCSTQVAPYQRVNAVGTDGRIEIEIPFNAPPDRPCRLWLQQGGEVREVRFDTADQYTLQGEAFARAVLDDTPPPTPLEDAVANMRAIERVFESAERGAWV